MALKPYTPKSIHSLFPDSPTNRFLHKESTCGCLYFSSIPCLTPAQTYGMPPVITLEISQTSAISTCMDYQGHIEYRRGLPSPKARLEDDLSRRQHRPCQTLEVYVCWSVNWDGPIPPYPGLPPWKHDALHFPSVFLLHRSHVK